MERFVKGDIVVLPFPYTDFLNTKKRPAVVLATLKGDDIILAQITTNKRDDENAVVLKKENFAEGFLKCDSFIRVSLIFTADSSRVEYKAGRLKQEKIKEVEEKLIKIFKK